MNFQEKPNSNNASHITKIREKSDDEYFYDGGMQNGRFSHKGKVINIKNIDSV